MKLVTFLILFTLYKSINSENLRTNRLVDKTNRLVNRTIELDYKLSNFNCTFAPDDCSNHGSCNLLGTECICDSDYTTFDSIDKQCDYKRKSQLTAFLLSFFFGVFGAGRWYIGDILIGSIKVCTIWGLTCCGTCGIALCFNTKNENSDKCVISCWRLFVSLFMLCWYIADIIIFATLKSGSTVLVDGNGIELKPW